MRVQSVSSWKVAASLLLAGVMLSGCGQADSSQPAPAPAAAEPAAAVKPLITVVQMEDWCREHAVPESICVLCNGSLVESYKSKGDWCAGHSVPESQCFVCHPELKEKFAAAYQAQYGKAPPAVQQEEPGAHKH